MIKLEILQRLFFNDLNCSGNLEDGLEYRGSGIVESKHFDSVPSVSGKDYCVVYISPFGLVKREWRAASEISIYAATDDDFERLKSAIECLEAEQNK